MILDLERVGHPPNTLGGNEITGTYYAFAGNTKDSAYNAVTTGAGLTSSVVSGAMGAPITYGRRTAQIVSLNLAGRGGLPQALSSSTGGVKRFLGKLGGAWKTAADVGFTLAEGVGCLGPQ